MVYNSYIFILCFLPLTLLGYFILNRFEKYTGAKIWLLFMSLYFYGYFNAYYLVIIIISILINYGIHIYLDKINIIKIKRIFLSIGLIFNVGILFYFKYYDFFVENINIITKSAFNLKNIILPLGISFFTFQQLSFIVDSYKGTMKRYNILDYSIFVTFFPQLVAGPIVLHNELIPQIENINNKKFNFDNFSPGLMAFSLGLAKKVLIADTFGKAVAVGYANVITLDTTNALLIMLAYTIQIYFDFSGYCDMATGIALMFNIDLPMNFNSPYKALTISEFWKRWHMTLTRFFTTYIYIPLGGNRKGEVRTLLNLMIVFLISGLWHGANWTFIIWGILHGIACVFHRVFGNKAKPMHPVASWIMTFGFINISWIFFRSPDIKTAIDIICKIFEFNFGPIWSSIIECFALPELTILFNYNYILIFMIFLIFAVYAILQFKNTNERISEFKCSIGNMIITNVLLIWCILSLAEVSVFLYFNF